MQSVNNMGNCVEGGMRGSVWELPIFSDQLFCKLKTALKNKDIN